MQTNQWKGPNFQIQCFHNGTLGAGPNGYPIPDPNPKFFSIPDPYPICFQNHRVFRVSGISENYIFDMENVVKEQQDIN